jgi:hypothetical protein
LERLVFSVYSAADFRPMSSTTQVEWVDVPRPNAPAARGITPVNQTDTFYVRLDTPPNARSVGASLWVRPEAGSAFSASVDNSTATGARNSAGVVSFTPVVNGQLITMGVYASTSAGAASHLKFQLSPGEVVVGLAVRYRSGDGELVPGAPRRIYDSRQPPSGTGPSPMLGGEERFIDVPVPWTTESAHAAILNLTVTATTGPGFLAVYPPGTPWLGTSTLNWSAGQTVANGVQVAVGVGGDRDTVGVWLRCGGMGQAHVIADLLGYYRPVDPAAGRLIG